MFRVPQRLQVKANSLFAGQPNDLIRVFDGNGTAVRGFDVRVSEGPVCRVGDAARNLRLDVEVVEGDVGQRRVLIGIDCEGCAGARRFDVGDGDIAQVRQPLFCGDRSRQNFPVIRVIRNGGRDGRVTVARIPVELDAEHGVHALYIHIVDANVLDGAAARAGGLEQDAVRDAGENVESISLDVADTARGFAAERHARRAGADGAVANDYFLRGPVDAQPIGVASRLEADGVVVAFDVAALDQNVGGGIDIDAIGAGPLIADVVADGDAIDGDIVRIADVDGRLSKRPERFTLDDL